MRTVEFALIAAVVLGFNGTVAGAAAAPARIPTQQERPTAAGERPDASAALDPARVITDQMRLEKRGVMTSLFSRSFKAAYDCVPRDEGNLGATILGTGYDVPNKVVRVSDPRYDDAADPEEASVTATLHYTNEDAPVASFDRSIVVVFIVEDRRWKIDDVHLIDPKGRRTGREVGLKRAFESLRRSKVGPCAGEAGRGGPNTRNQGVNVANWLLGRVMPAVSACSIKD